MTDTRRMILWVIFSMSLFGLWDSWQHFNGHSSIFFGPSQTAPALPKGIPNDLPAASRALNPGAPANPVAAGAIQDGALAPSVGAATPIQTVSIRTDVLVVDVSSSGASIDRVELLKHRDTLDPKKNMVLLEDTAEHVYVAQTGLVGAPGLPSHHTNFNVVPGPTSLQDGQDQLEVSFQAESGGVRLVKTLIFTRGSYEIGVRHQITNLSDQPIDPKLYLQLVRDASKPEGTMRFYSPYYGPALYSAEDKFQKISFEDIEKGKDRATQARNSKVGWVGILQHYFAAIWIPKDGEERSYLTEEIKGTPPTYRAAALMDLGPIAPKASATNVAELFVGPEEQRLLEKVAPGLDLIRDYGWTTILARPVFWLLEKLHSLLGNWGAAIIMLTVLIKSAFYPLSAASYRSMARMKNVAPRLKVLQEKYKDDRAKLNQAMMELYRTEKINPAGGCLPVLVQIPVFISLYSVLSASVEMRGAPWIGWIHDLAAPDPFYILPAVMMVSMFVQYKLNPAPPDPVQAKMMMIMPLVFGVTFFFFPAGLVLYWVVNNLLSIAQQWQISRMHGGAKKT
ncbi:MAG: membrane protein insertase YidC [Burkholderiaceae bacterium]|jgi:YidC/Oxa1 family membrane protein insertase